MNTIFVIFAFIWMLLPCVRLKAQSVGIKDRLPTAEYNALVDLYNFTGGPFWNAYYGWLDPKAANWPGVSISGGHVTGIDLSNNKLSGSIPTSLSNLTQLQNLYLHVNQLSGSIPASLGNLAQLQNLFLHDNQLTGSIPASLGNLTQLQFLHLGRNPLSGGIPESLTNLTRLQTLWLYDNQLSGSIPASLSNLSQLQYLQLDHNQLSGGIPASLGNLTQLRGLSLDNNQLSGSIPASLGNLVQLQTLLLQGNQLTGVVPDFTGFTYKTINIVGNLFNIEPGSESLINIKAMIAARNSVDYLPQAPSLNIMVSEGHATISWPAWTITYNYHLEVSESLTAGTSWTEITNGITTSGNFTAFTTSVEADRAFYRLRLQ